MGSDYLFISPVMSIGIFPMAGRYGPNPNPAVQEKSGPDRQRAAVLAALLFVLRIFSSVCPDCSASQALYSACPFSLAPDY